MSRTLFFVLGLAAVVGAQSPMVVSTSPLPNRDAGPFAPVRVTFSAPITPATVTPFSVSVFGRWTGAVAGSVSVDPTGTIVTFQPSKPMFVGDAIQVSLASSITSASTSSPLVGGYHFQFEVRTAPGSGVFQLTSQIPIRLPNEGPISTYGIHGGDVDRDGAPDLTAINELSHDIRVFKNDGCGHVSAMTLVQDGYNWPSPQESADFNRDGWLDLATGDYLFGNLSVYLNDGQGNYLAPLTLPGGSYLRSVGAADLNGDGYPDLVSANSSQTLVWLNNGSGGFLPPVSYAAPYGSAEFNIVDANEDGHLDICVCDLVPSHLWVLIGNGDGTFTPNSTYVAIGAYAFASAAGDLNGDGHVDMCFCCHNPPTFNWFYGDGHGGFTLGGSAPAGGSPTSVHLGDLDGDGDLDAALSDYGAAEFRVFFNGGTGNFGAPVILPAVSGASCTTLIDFDRDGDLDIVGADEIADVAMVYSQVGPTIPGIQQPDCAATLRIDQRGAGDGFAGRPAVPVRLGDSMAISLSGTPGGLGIVAVGFTATTPLQWPWGLVSFDLTLPNAILLVTALDPHGEALTPFSLPSWLQPGFRMCVQGAVFSPAVGLLTNPVQFELIP